jgi:hypothetical protein
MQQTPTSISPFDLYAELGTASAPVIVDVRRPSDFAWCRGLQAETHNWPATAAKQARHG